MKKIGLLFTPKNRALVRLGLKTQTRRGDKRLDGLSDRVSVEWWGNPMLWSFMPFAGESVERKCPYGNSQIEPVQYYLKEPVQVLDRGWDSKANTFFADLRYPDDGSRNLRKISVADDVKLLARQDWRKPSSSMFMLQAFARTWLPGVRTWPERLGDMSAADAIAEGIEINPAFSPAMVQDILLAPVDARYFRDYLNPGRYTLPPVQSYASLWESINGKGSWNPEKWVWGVEWQAPRVAA